MAGSINEFKSSFRKDLARPNRFDVILNAPAGILAAGSSNRERFTFRCESAELPGRSLMTHDQKTYGPIEKYPYMNTYTDIDMTFIVDDDMSQKVFFDAWMNYINPLYNNNMRYKGDYSTVITVNQYDVTNNISYSVNLYDAYPISMNQMDLDWSADGYHKLNVTFAYTYWQNNSLQALGMQFVQAGVASVVDALGGLGGSASAGLGTGINGMLDGVSGFNGTTLQNTGQAAPIVDKSTQS